MYEVQKWVDSLTKRPILVLNNKQNIIFCCYKDWKFGRNYVNKMKERLNVKTVLTAIE